MGNLVIGLNFTLIGMGIVFSFLVTLVVAVNIMKVVVGFLEKRAPVSSTAGGDEEVAAVIAEE
jgi:sodium pump decarboxylase gamma subunit